MKHQLSEKVKEIIDRIAKEHCNKVFGYLDKDDLKGEIWVICIQALEEYDEQLGVLENFLRRTVKNRLVNRFKDLTRSVRSPCPRCQFFDPGNSPSDCSKFGDERLECNKWRNYQLSVNSRNSLLNAAEDQYERHYNDNVCDKMISKEASEIIEENLNKEYLNDFYKIKDGRIISKQKFKKLKSEIRKILLENKFITEEE